MVADECFRKVDLFYFLDSNIEIATLFPVRSTSETRRDVMGRHCGWKRRNFGVSPTTVTLIQTKTTLRVARHPLSAPNHLMYVVFS